MGDGLPSEFDLVVVGTGVTECIVSAAASRNGHTVLHLDPREYYGSTWATLNFDAWLSCDFSLTPDPVNKTSFNSPGKLGWRNCSRDVEHFWYDARTSTKEEFLKNKRKFNIDVFPQVVLAREDLIELLIKSDVSRYLEFLRVGKLFTQLPNPEDSTIVSIPLSRSDIFTSKSVSLTDKRLLVKFIEAVMKRRSEAGDEGETSQAGEEFPDGLTFEEMAKKYKLSQKVKHLIKSVVQRVEDDLLNGEGQRFEDEFVPRCRNFLESIGRFGNQTPYLWPLYGMSEICQAFSRLSAVYGSIFILKRYISSIDFNPEGSFKIQLDNDELTAKYLVLGPELEYIKPEQVRPSRKFSGVTRTVGRGVIVTRGGSLKFEEDTTSKGDGICFYRIGKLQIIELSYLSHAVPKDYRMLQVTFAAKNNEQSCREVVESHLLPFLDMHLISEEATATPEEQSTEGTSSQGNNQGKPQAVFGSFFWLDLFDSSECESSPGVFSCSVGSANLSEHIIKAREIFEKMYPEEEFLPKPPDVEPHDPMNGDLEGLPPPPDVMEQEENPNLDPEPERVE